MNETEDKMKLVTVSRKHFMRPVFWFSFVLFPFGYFLSFHFSLFCFSFSLYASMNIEMRKQIRSMGANHHMQIREISLVSGLYEQFSYCPLSCCNHWYLYCVLMCFYFLIRWIFVQAVLREIFQCLFFKTKRKKYVCKQNKMLLNAISYVCMLSSLPNWNSLIFVLKQWNSKTTKETTLIACIVIVLAKIIWFKKNFQLKITVHHGKINSHCGNTLHKSLKTKWYVYCIAATKVDRFINISTLDHTISSFFEWFKIFWWSKNQEDMHLATQTSQS